MYLEKRMLKSTDESLLHGNGWIEEGSLDADEISSPFCKCDDEHWRKSNRNEVIRKVNLRQLKSGIHDLSKVGDFSEKMRPGWESLSNTYWT